MCKCAKVRRPTRAPQSAQPNRRAELFGSGGMELLDYLGDEARETIYGRETGQRYTVGTERQIILIDSRDRDTMLAMTNKHGQTLFQPHAVVSSEVSIEE